LRNEGVADSPRIADPGARVSVVIPTRNRRELVVAIVQRVLEENGLLEVVVVDDGSTDDTGERLAEIARTDGRLRIVPGLCAGAGMARTEGASAARGDVILFLDDDVMPAPGLPAMHLAHHSDQRELVVVGYMPTRVPARPGPETFTTFLYAREYEGRCKKYEQDPTGILRNLWMGNVSIAREKFLDATARWPEPLPRFRHEDQHLGMRMLSMGMHAVFDRTLLSVHEHHRSIDQFRRDCWQDGAGTAVLELRHLDLVDAAGPEQFRAGLPRPVASVVAIASGPRIGKVVASTLATVTRTLGRLRLFQAQTAAARALRRVEQQRGYLAQSTAAPNARRR
jgi:glycosyltransferase involved in cell wall biosynthesis